MKSISLSIILLLLFGTACTPTSQKKSSDSESHDSQQLKFQNKGHELVYQMVQKVGNFDSLKELNDVTYTYTYQTPEGKTDLSHEMYIFANELSYGKYLKHERSRPDLEGVIEQGYDGKEFWYKHNGKVLDEEADVKKARFNRKTNFYWFAMFQKLLDPGLVYDYVGEKVINHLTYDVVKVSFTPVDQSPTDIYQVYLNQDTHLVDQFLFTVADFGVMDTPLLMEVEYESVDGIMMPSKRRYKKSTWDAEVSDQPWITVTWTDIKFNSGLKPEDFSK